MRLLPIALTYFLEVARTGSVSEAATELTVAPSAISRQIAKLEAGLGVPLFVRHPRGMVPTEAGTRLLDHVRRSEAESAVLVDELRTGRGLHARSLTVACSEGFARRVVPQAVAAFRRDHDVTFHIDVVTRDEATRRVLEGAADVAVTFATGPQHGVRVESAVVVPVYAIVPLDHPLTGRESVGLAELCRHPLALPAPGQSLRDLFDIAARIENLTAQPVLECNELSPKYEFVRCGGGIALVGGLGDIEQDAATEGVAYVLLDNAVFRKREAQVQTMAGRTLSLAAMRFTALLTSFVRPPVSRSGLRD
ncbi:LysR family transcriptional regulator [Amycolatopsis roodepoortensis]|uniref:LysR family transcriptional regulator n=1 Tax=Amycolatopsis roodepoortensis TaxID=700274 RepID=UPI00214C6A71|nr:LysR family transcriptional regulator [Amycolatopsis roodepoortensis]UUV32841.1 LysR family transcriptional regulator [Amycolatopsis roodepoortensis]